MTEVEVAARLKEKNPELLWKPVGDRWGSGVPDRCVLWRGVGKVIWVELKHLAGLPKRNCKVGLKTRQAAWLDSWQKDGGCSALIIGVKSECKVAVVSEGFRRISSEGMKREEFEMIKYEDVTNKLKSLMRD